MKQYKPNRIPDNIVTFLATGYTNGSCIIIALYNGGVYTLNNVYTGQEAGKTHYKWMGAKTGYGYDLCSSYLTIKAACDKLIDDGAEILLFDDYLELFELLTMYNKNNQK